MNENKMTLEQCALLLDKFKSTELTTKVKQLEHAVRHSDKGRAESLLLEENICGDLFKAANVIKNTFGEINVIIHAVGILTMLPQILEPGEVVEYVSLGAGNTGRKFDLETNVRIAEFKFISWQGGSESIRQNSLFKDFYYLAEENTSKKKELYLLELKHPLKFLTGGRAISSIVSRVDTIKKDFELAHGTAFRIVHEYYEYRKASVQLIDMSGYLNQDEQ